MQIARVFVDKCLELVLRDQLDTATASLTSRPARSCLNTSRYRSITCSREVLFG